jgi:hypothetical protein
LNLFELET